MEAMMQYKDVVNNILKRLPQDYPPFSIVGTGAFGVCIDTHCKKHKVQNAYKPFKLVTILSTERSKEEMENINEIKKSLYHKGVHVALSDNIKELNCPLATQNPHIKQAMEEYNAEFIFSSSWEENGIMYDEVFVDGKIFKIYKDNQYPKASKIPQQHITKFVFDAFQILSSGLEIDFNGGNILYHPQKGFYFIDLNLQMKPNSVFYFLVWTIRKIFMPYDLTNKKYISAQIKLDTKISNALDLLCKVFPNAKNNEELTEFRENLKGYTNELKHILNTNEEGLLPYVKSIENVI